MIESNWKVSLPALYTLDNLHRATVKCSRRTKWKGQVQRFLLYELTEITTLRDQVLAGTWRPRKGKTFIRNDRGKRRTITPRDMRTRVVEQVMCDDLLEGFILSEVVHGCSACLRGRGLSYAYADVKSFLERTPIDGFELQYDFHDHFGSMDRTAALARLERHFTGDVVDLIATIIGGPGIGFDLGSNVSQHLGTWYPTPLDRTMIELPGLVGYHRHMDDGLATFETRDQAMHGLDVLREEAASLGLTLNPRKTHINRVTHPHIYCGMRFEKRPKRVKMNLPKKNTRRSVRHTKSVIARSKTHEIDLVPVRASGAGHLDSGDALLSPRLYSNLDWGGQATPHQNHIRSV